MALSRTSGLVARLGLALLAGCYASRESEEPEPIRLPRPRLIAGGDAAQPQRIVLSGPQRSALFGISLDVFAENGVARLLIGAPGAESSSGSAFLFHGPFVAARAAEQAELALHGAIEGARAGDAVAAGDLDGDGIAELAIGASQANDSAGMVYVVEDDGSRTRSLSEADAIVAGERALDNLGLSIDVAQGRIGQPGALWVGVPHAGGGYEGEALAFRGASQGELIESTPNLVLSDSVAGGHAGTALATDCDVDGDGHADTLIGAWGDDSQTTGGAAYLVSGRVEGSVSLAEATAVIRGTHAGDGVGTRVFLHDLNDDDLCDVLIGAPGVGMQAGALYGFFGPIAGQLETSDADFLVRGGAPGDGVGLAIAAGDQDGDGISDLWIGAPGHDGAGPESGAVYLLYGPPDPSLTLDRDAARLLGQAEGDHFGAALAAGVDLDGDGAQDLAVGAWGAKRLAGEVAIVLNR